MAGLIERALPKSRAAERRLPYALSEVRDVQMAAAFVGKHPLAAELAVGALGSEGALHRRQHRHLTVRAVSFRPAGAAPTCDPASDTDRGRLGLPVDGCPPQPYLL